MTMSNSIYSITPVSASTVITGPSNLVYSNGASNYAAVTANNNTLQVSGDANIDGALKVNGVDVGQTLKAIQDRLAILVPDPEKLEKFAALKEAYEHYKTLEALCK